MRPLRVAQVVTALVAGGAQLQALALAERLPRDRFQVDFLSLGGEGPYDERARAAGLEVVHLGHRATPGESMLAIQRRRLGSVAGYLRTVRGRYDIVDAWLYPNDIEVALGRIVTRTPVVMTGRRNMQAHERFGRLGRVVDRVVDRQTDAVVANSQAVADYAVRVHGVDPRRIHIVHNGVEPIPPMDAAARAAIRARWAVPMDALVVGAVGRFHPIKGHDLLLDAFAAADPGAVGAHLVLVGDGDRRSALEAQARELGIADLVHLPGAEPDPRAVYGAMDIAAQASRSEGMPNALLEAGAAGLPIVATAVGGTPDIITSDAMGVVVPAGDVGALAGGLRRLLADAPLRARMGAAVRAHVDASFGMDRFVREYGDLYASLAAKRGVDLGA
jgi:glycosyltransferase involved in cell wall biosynthesis